MYQSCGETKNLKEKNHLEIIILWAFVLFLIKVVSICPVSICHCEHLSCEHLSLGALVLWAFVLWAFVLWAFVLWAFVLEPWSEYILIHQTVCGIYTLPSCTSYLVNRCSCVLVIYYSVCVCAVSFQFLVSPQLWYNCSHILQFLSVFVPLL